MSKETFKKSLIIIVIIAILAILSIFYFQDKTSTLNESEIVVKDYSYTYKKETSSNQIRGVWETLSFKHQDANFNLKSEQTGPGPSYGQTSFTYNFSDDKPINLYIPGEELPNNCVGDINSPDNFEP